MKSILSLTINPAIDASCSVETVFPITNCVVARFVTNRRRRGERSRAIRNLGGDSTVFYLAGGPSGQILGLLLDREGLKHEAVSIEDWTRENYSVIERTSGQQYRFVTPGPDLRAEEWKSCLAKIGSLDLMPDFVVASGSLPPGAPTDFYGQLQKWFAGNTAVLFLIVPVPHWRRFAQRQRLSREAKHARVTRPGRTRTHQ